MNKKDKLELMLIEKIELLVSEHGYALPDGRNFFLKKVNDNVGWFFTLKLTGQRDYSIFSKIGAIFFNSTKIIENLITDSGYADYKIDVGFSQWISKYAHEISEIYVRKEGDIDGIGRKFTDSLRKAEEIYLLPRIDQRVVVDEFLKVPVKWPTGDLLQCVFNIVGYGMAHNNDDLTRQGINRAFEFLDRPNYSQEYREFFEWFKKKLFDGVSRSNL